MTSAAQPVREGFETVPPYNIFRLLANAETAFPSAREFSLSILTRLELDPRVREIAILRVARLSAAEYEWTQHVAVAQHVGVQREQVDAIERGELEAECLPEAWRVVLRFVSEVVRDVRPTQATFDALTALFSPRQIVELTLVVGWYMTLARVMEVAEIDPDPPAAEKTLDGMQIRHA